MKLHYIAGWAIKCFAFGRSHRPFVCFLFCIFSSRTKCSNGKIANPWKKSSAFQKKNLNNFENCEIIWTEKKKSIELHLPFFFILQLLARKNPSGVALTERENDFLLNGKQFLSENRFSHISSYCVNAFENQLSFFYYISRLTSGIGNFLHTIWMKTRSGISDLNVAHKKRGNWVQLKFLLRSKRVRFNLFHTKSSLIEQMKTKKH